MLSFDNKSFSPCELSNYHSFTTTKNVLLSLSAVERTYDIHIDESVLKFSSIWKKNFHRGPPRSYVIPEKPSKNVFFCENCYVIGSKNFFSDFFIISNQFANFSQKKIFPVVNFRIPQYQVPMHTPIQRIFGVLLYGSIKWNIHL